MEQTIQTKLHWKKGLLSNSFNIYSDDQQVGTLKGKTFSQTADAKFQGKEYTFKTDGFFKQRTKIIDSLENKVIGEIAYNGLMTKATLSFNDQAIHWKYDNLWNTKWSLCNSQGIHIKYSGSLTSGQVESNIDEAVLLLSGMWAEIIIGQSQMKY